LVIRVYFKIGIGAEWYSSQSLVMIELGTF